jgi:hypothetical protein
VIARAHIPIGRRECVLALALAAFTATCAAGASGMHPSAQPAASGAPASVSAQGAAFAVSRWVIAGGGGSSSGGVFRIEGTIAQPDADPLHPATGGAYAISGGFWPGFIDATTGGGTIFANGFE